jgi:hypothetical protein
MSRRPANRLYCSRYCDCSGWRGWERDADEPAEVADLMAWTMLLVVTGGVALIMVVTFVLRRR